MADILDIKPINAEMTIFKTEVEPNKLNACIDNILMRVDRLETKFAKVPPVDTENMATVSNEFICKKCGIHIKDYIKVVLNEDNDGYIDEQHYDYEPKFCPECGAKVKECDAE